MGKEQLRRTIVAKDQLQIVDESIWKYVLASGGPLMKIVAVEGENILCMWQDAEDNRKLHRALFPIVCVRRVIPLTEDDLGKFRGA
jgi:hypothetical protein